ncbi:hypothetical protein TH63_10870 [Rufibacter radiotolerans]|uniref:Outer membrane protein beta-barrel domain n=2 Tax=Rufibacter radiotolerans TaxID=1379910 RepID=A0A0H4VQ18_9BACT|nr:hypothetical protein TH63_10870 [Rufibacter radiotolerans]
MSDQELDHLFRESAERYTPAFDPEAWTAMDQKLDAAQGQGAGWFREKSRYLLLLLFLGISLVPFFYLNRTPQPATTSPAAQQNTVLQAATEPAKLKSSPIEETTIINKDQQQETAIKPETAGQTAYTGTKEEKATRQRSAPASRRGSNGYRVPLGIGRKTKAGVPVKVTLTEEKNERNNILPEAKPSFSPSLRDSVSSQGNALAAEVPVSPALQQNAGEVGLPDSAAVAEEELPADKESPFLKSISFMVAVAPDFTTVKFKDAEAVSMNGGVLVAVPLTKRVSLVTGAVYANKKYTSPPEEYSWPAAYAHIEYGKVEATCQVLDIPVNLQYRFWEKGQSSLGVAAGLSSYLMLNEEYYSSSPAGFGYGARTYNWEVDNQNRHWFGVQNISLNYTRTFPSGIALGAEPFVKIPLQGIGAGKVKLTSAGVFFTAGYTFNLKP